MLLRSRLRDAAVGLFGLVAAAGIHRVPPFDRLFLSLYDFYKRYFEAGPIERLREFVTGGSLAIDTEPMPERASASAPSS